jgi:hypothetical protein
MTKIDPYKHKERYLEWKKEVSGGIIKDINKDNSKVILDYISDMETGLNVAVSSKKGSRSYIRLNNLRQRLTFLAKLFEEKSKKSLLELSERDVCGVFNAMRTGEIKKVKGGEYKSVRDFVKPFKAFWHWHQKVSRKDKKEIIDITIDLDTKQTKPEWVYLTEEQFKRLCDNALYEYKVLMMFLLDTGIRSPTELVNIKVSDLSSDFKELNIKEEISKTFGRRIKIMLCSELLKDYIKNKGLEKDNQLFDIHPPSVNKYFNRLGKRVLGDEKSLAGQKYSELTLYDFRHNSACYWLPRYKSESALKYRFGWKKTEQIHYYTELLGMKDTIAEEDLMLNESKTELEKRVSKVEQEKELLQEEVNVMREQMKQILEATNLLSIKLTK